MVQLSADACEVWVPKWEQVIATPPILERQGPDFMQGIAPHWVGAGTARGIGAVVSWFIDDLTIKEGVVPPYPLAGLEVNWQRNKTPVSVAPWRSFWHSHNAFFIESFADDLAHSQKQDPMDFRLQMLSDNQPRLLKTLEAVATACKWSSGPSAGRFRGVAAHESFKGHAAMVVEVSIDTAIAASVKVEQVWVAIDCRVPVNPDGIAQQLEGSVIFGLSAALYGEISIEKGAVQQSNFHDYPLLRNVEAPQVHTVSYPAPKCRVVLANLPCPWLHRRSPTQFLRPLASVDAACPWSSLRLKGRREYVPTDP
jgi:isoquinoline 1-oxidoreductase subunit beta